MRPIPGHLDAVAVDEYWRAGEHGNPAKGSHLQGGVFIIEPSLVPVFGVTMQLSMRKFNFFPFLNGDATKFSVGTVYEFSTPDQMKEVSEQLNGWLFL